MPLSTRARLRYYLFVDSLRYPRATFAVGFAACVAVALMGKC